MELRQLRYFKVVADARSFARGAQNLRVAQPALSRSIAKLEDEIGHMLFVRHSAGVSMTEAGVRFYAHATQILSGVRALVEGMSEEDGVPKGTIAIGAPQSILSKLVLPAAAEFLTRFQHCRLDVIQNSSARLRDQVAEGTIDLAILSNFTVESGMHFTPLLRENICLVCRREDRAAFGEVVELDQLLELPLVVSGHPDSLRLYIDKRFPHHRDTLNVRSEVNSSSMVADLVSRGVGFGIAPYVAQRAGHALDFVPIRDLEASWAIAVNWNRRGLRAVEELQTLIIQHVATLVGTGQWPTASLLS